MLFIKSLVVNGIVPDLAQNNISIDVVEKYLSVLIDAMVFELYLEETLKKAGKGILEYLTDLKPIANNMTDHQKLEIIGSEFDRLYDKDHPVRNNLFYMDSVPEIRIIKGLDKDANK